MDDLYNHLREADDLSVDTLLSTYSTKEEIDEELSVWDMGRILTYPEVLPCAFDVNMERWLYRINIWGKLNIMHFDPVTGRKSEITQGQLLKFLSDPTMLNTFGKWNVKKLDIKSVELWRDYKDLGGKKRHEKIIVDIELKDSIKQALNMKFK